MREEEENNTVSRKVNEEKQFRGGNAILGDAIAQKLGDSRVIVLAGSRVTARPHLRTMFSFHYA